MPMFDPASRATWTGTLAARLYQRSLWLERPALRSAVSLARATPADRLLDVGTGTGALLAMLASSPNRPERAIGLDRSGSMLAAAPPLPEGCGRGGGRHGAAVLRSQLRRGHDLLPAAPPGAAGSVVRPSRGAPRRGTSGARRDRHGRCAQPPAAL